MCLAVKTFFRLLFRLISKIKLKYVILGIISLALLDFFGAFTHLMEITYDAKFSYPYDGDVQPFVFALRNKQQPEVPPINQYNYTFLLTPQKSCNDVQYQSLRVVYLVKSSADNFNRRIAIRSSWGFEKRFFDVASKTVFLLGVRPGDEELQMKIKLESQKHQDIVQADFVDSYFNNTIKTMIGFKWAVQHCPKSKFYMFVDDDIYVSVKNVLRFVRNPTNYPDYLKETRRFGFGRKREIRDSETPKNHSKENSEKNVMKENLDSRNQTEFHPQFIENRSFANNFSTQNSWQNSSGAKYPIGSFSTKNSAGRNSLNENCTERSSLKENFAERNSLGENSAGRKSLNENSAGRNSLNENFADKNSLVENSAGRKSLNENFAEKNSALEKSSQMNHTSILRKRRATAREKIELRRRPGWSSHNKTQFVNKNSKEENLSAKEGKDFAKNSTIAKRQKRQVFDFELPDDVRLYAGFVFVSAPHRHRTSKWYVSLEEYPYHLWPPYVTAGSYILSKEALIDMYYTSFYTKHFRFDDIYLGFVAKKAEIEPFHCEEFHFYKKDYNKYNYKYVITSHGYGNPEELLDIWNEQKAMGNA